MITEDAGSPRPVEGTVIRKVIGMDKETAWLLEKGPAHAPQYATVKNGMLDWTPPGQHETALRMARRADADALAEIVEDADRVAEHAWV